MSQAINTEGIVGGPGPGGLNTKRLPPLETGSSSERKEKKRTEQNKSKTEKTKEDLARLGRGCQGEKQSDVTRKYYGESKESIQGTKFP